jgi:ABC-type antimicrobial peptide transport system permease subunit
VLRSILGGGMLLVAVGAAAGLAAALTTAHLIEKLLFGVKAKDPAIYVAVVLGIAAVGLLANWIPARRAAAVDPMRALRTE